MNRNSNQTSASFLYSVAASAEQPRIGELAFDVYIKARSFAIMNKIAFAVAILGTLLLIVWPVLVVAGVWADGILDNPVAQTALTALTGFAGLIYAHYKKKQMLTENLLRTIAFSGRPAEELAALVVKEMPKIDLGAPLGDRADET